MAAKPKSGQLDAVIGANVRRYREELSASQDDVARALHEEGTWRASGATISAIESGGRAVRVDELFLLAEVLNIPAHLLLEIPDGHSVTVAGATQHGFDLVHRLALSPHEDWPDRWADLAQRRRQELQFTSDPGGHGTSILDNVVGEAERHAARRLGVPAEEIVERSRRLWSQTLTGKRDALAAARVEPDASERRQAAVRSHVTRELLDVLREDIEQHQEQP